MTPARKNKVSPKTFKKWIMGIGGFSRNDAEFLRKYISDRKGALSYQKVYSENADDPSLTGILDSIFGKQFEKGEL